MSMELLVRDDLNKAEKDPIDELDAALMKDAEKLFGYSAKDSAEEKWVAEREAKIEAALNKLGIKPFTNDSVVEYKAAVRNEELKKRSNIWADIHHTYSFWSFFVSAGVGLAALVGAAAASIWGFHMPFLWAATGCGAVCLLAIFAAVATLDDANAHDRIEVSWASKNLCSYEKKIPEFALQTACDLKKLLPSVSLYVDEVHVQRMPQPDPFLYAVIENGTSTLPDRQSTRRYYLEVWNEPKYKQQREA